MAASEQTVWEVLRSIDDPEMPISIVDLGIVVRVACEGADVAIDITPTYTGCPALAMIDDLITERVGRLAGVDAVNLKHVFDPPWSAARISDAGRERLAEHGVTVGAPDLVQLGLVVGSVVLCLVLVTGDVPGGLGAIWDHAEARAFLGAALGNPFRMPPLSPLLAEGRILSAA